MNRAIRLALAGVVALGATVAVGGTRTPTVPTDARPLSYTEAGLSARPASTRGEPSETTVSRQAFEVEVASLAGRADRIDGVWNRFRGACPFAEADPRDGARGWLAIWQGSTGAGLSDGFCRDMFNQIVELAGPLNAAMTVAEDAARRRLSSGEVREIRRRHRMDWDGWGRPLPKRLER